MKSNREKFIGLYPHVRKEERLKINEVSMHQKNLKSNYKINTKKGRIK